MTKNNLLFLNVLAICTLLISKFCKKAYQLLQTVLNSRTVAYGIDVFQKLIELPREGGSARVHEAQNEVLDREEMLIKILK